MAICLSAFCIVAKRMLLHICTRTFLNRGRMRGSADLSVREASDINRLFSVCNNLMHPVVLVPSGQCPKSFFHIGQVFDPETIVTISRLSLQQRTLLFALSHCITVWATSESTVRWHGYIHFNPRLLSEK